MIRRTLSTLGLSLALSGGCREEATAPIDPVWGKQPCAHCAMLVTETAPAAQLVDADGERRFFDDIGCMVSWAGEHPAARRLWVRSPKDDGWIDAKTAQYRTDARTPMDSGYLAVQPPQQGIGWAQLRPTAPKAR